MTSKHCGRAVCITWRAHDNSIHRFEWNPVGLTMKAAIFEDFLKANLKLVNSGMLPNAITKEILHSHPSVALWGLLLSYIHLQQKKAPVASQNSHEINQSNMQCNAVSSLPDKKTKTSFKILRTSSFALQHGEHSSQLEEDSSLSQQYLKKWSHSTVPVLNRKRPPMNLEVQ